MRTLINIDQSQHHAYMPAEATPGKTTLSAFAENTTPCHKANMTEKHSNWDHHHRLRRIINGSILEK
jgi:hypothetical protein